MDKAFEVVNSPWFQMLAPIATAYAAYRFPKQTAGIASLLATLLGALKAPEAKKD